MAAQQTNIVLTGTHKSPITAHYWVTDLPAWLIGALPMCSHLLLRGHPQRAPIQSNSFSHPWGQESEWGRPQFMIRGHTQPTGGQSVGQPPHPLMGQFQRVSLRRSPAELSSLCPSSHSQESQLKDCIGGKDPKKTCHDSYVFQICYPSSSLHN